jgi:hypothetical protein
MRPFVIHRSTVVVAALLGQSCLPFALPPGKASIGAGRRHYSESFKGAGTASGDETIWQLRAALHPLGLARSLRYRTIDFGVGYSTEVDTGREPTAISGPFVDIEVFPWHFGSARQLRLGAIASPLLIVTDPGGFADGIDAGVDLRLEFEGAGFSGGGLFSTADEDSNDDDVVTGFSYGEWALGVWVGGGMRSVGESTVWSAALGVSGRWPGVVGVICCALPGD